MSEKLSNLEINFAQCFLKLQFPELNGLDSTLLQQKKAHFKSEKLQSKLQIIHCFSRDHWIVATNIGCVNGVICVYDSLFHSVDEATKRINNLFLFDLDKAVAKIKVSCPQKQTNGTDCGVFAIAWAFTIAFGKKPSERKICETKARLHLARCFETEKLLLFPTKTK